MAQQTYGEWMRSNPEAPKNDYKTDQPVTKNHTLTALDWYYDQTVVLGKANYAELLEQAKKMEKEQIMNAWRNGDNDSRYCPKVLNKVAEQYYNETYGTEHN